METATPQTPASSTPLPARADAWLAFAVLCEGLLLATLNLSSLLFSRAQIEGVLNIKEQLAHRTGYDEALPPLQFDLSTVLYALLFILSMPLWILLVRGVGYRRVCMTAMLLFAVSSLGVAITGSRFFGLQLYINWLLCWRIVQATSGSAFLPLVIAQSKHVSLTANAGLYYPSLITPAIRIGIYLLAGMSFALSFFYSMLIATQFTDWFWVPLLNVIFGIGAYCLLRQLSLDAPEGEMFDGLGWTLLAILLLVVLCVIKLHITTQQTMTPIPDTPALMRIRL